MNNKIPTDDSGLEVNHDGSGNMTAGSGLREKGGERGVVLSLLVRWHTAIGLDSVLQAVQFPASISDLDSGLADVDRDDLTLKVLI